MKNLNYSTEQILIDIRSDKTGRDKAITYLFHDQKLRICIQTMIFKMGGTKDNFKEVFTSTLMQFAKTVIHNKDLVIKYELNTYITSIAKYLWMAQKKKEIKLKPQDDILKENYVANSPETIVLKKEKYALLYKLMEEQGTNCKEVLMYWANGFKMKEIAQLMNYKSADMAKKKKYQSFKSLVNYLENNPNLKAALR